MLANYDVVLLAKMPSLDADKVTALTNWVNAGGNLIAMAPDPQLASLLGISPVGSTLSNGYLLVDTSAAPGNGIVGQTIQFHGSADLYTLSGAAAVATLYSTATTSTGNPAVTLRAVGGAGGGMAAAFAYDLAESIVYTRQGNPAWAAQERDGLAPIRSDDKFYGNKVGDVQPDWVDLDKVAIPQADEQQRLLANLILHMNSAKKPLPRFWYFPNGKKAVVIMTGDDHGNNGTFGRFEQFKALSPAGLQCRQLGVRARHLVHVSVDADHGCASRRVCRRRLRGRYPHQHRVRRTTPSLNCRPFYDEQVPEFAGRCSRAPGRCARSATTASPGATGAVAQRCS